MSDDFSPLPWSAQQWARLRAAAQEAANKARVASSFLPKSGPLPPGQTTVPSQWMSEKTIEDPRTGEAKERLEVNAGRTLELTTISSNIFLRGTEVEDPSLGVAEAKIRRAAEILGRLEDAIIFNGLGDAERSYPMRDKEPIVKPPIYTVTGGHGLTGLLQAPGTLLRKKSRRDRNAFNEASNKFVKAVLESAGDDQVTQTKAVLEEAKRKLTITEGNVTDKNDELLKAKKDLEAPSGDPRKFAKAEGYVRALNKELAGVMCVVYLGEDQVNAPIVSAVVQAIEKLEKRGQFGPFAAIFGDDLFADAHRPNDKSLVLPSDRILPFLGRGGSLLRSSTIPADEGVIIALAGDPIDLVVGTDLEVKYLQTTEEPRYVLRVFERFVLRIKQLDAICAISSGNCLTILNRGRHYREPSGDPDSGETLAQAQ